MLTFLHWQPTVPKSPLLSPHAPWPRPPQAVGMQFSSHLGLGVGVGVGVGVGLGVGLGVGAGVGVGLVRCSSRRTRRSTL